MRLLITVFLILGAIRVHAENNDLTLEVGAYVEATFDRAAFYAAMGSKDLATINTQLQLLQKAAIKEKEAFTGALLMKKAGLVGGPAKKLKTFKEGHEKLEAALAKESNNAEFRFLRLMIQENAPKILNYDKDLATDSEFITKHFSELPPAVQKAVTDYSKRSKVLKAI